MDSTLIFVGTVIGFSLVKLCVDFYMSNKAKNIDNCLIEIKFLKDKLSSDEVEFEDIACDNNTPLYKLKGYLNHLKRISLDSIIVDTLHSMADTTFNSVKLNNILTNHRSKHIDIIHCLTDREIDPIYKFLKTAKNTLDIMKSYNDKQPPNTLYYDTNVDYNIKLGDYLGDKVGDYLGDKVGNQVDNKKRKLSHIIETYINTAENTLDIKETTPLHVLANIPYQVLPDEKINIPYCSTIVRHDQPVNLVNQQDKASQDTQVDQKDTSKPQTSQDTQIDHKDKAEPQASQDNSDLFIEEKDELQYIGLNPICETIMENDKLLSADTSAKIQENNKSTDLQNFNEYTLYNTQYNSTHTINNAKLYRVPKEYKKYSVSFNNIKQE